jgi:hypothetical protein
MCERMRLKSTLNSTKLKVQLLENTNAYVHVQVGVDDGSLPGSMVPLTKSFVCQKSDASAVS